MTRKNYPVLILAALIATVAIMCLPYVTRADAVPSGRDPLVFGATVQTTTPTRTMGPEGYEVAAVRRLPYGHLALAFRNGASYDVAPCRREDSRRCYWDADRRGNSVGVSFVRLHHRLYML